MKAILINSHTRSVSEVDYDGTLEDAYRLIGCQYVEAVGLDNGDAIYVDEEGLLRNPVTFFSYEGVNNEYQPYFAGNGLIVGTIQNGDEAPVMTDLTQAQHAVRFARTHG